MSSCHHQPNPQTTFLLHEDFLSSGIDIQDESTIVLRKEWNVPGLLHLGMNVSSLEPLLRLATHLYQKALPAPAQLPYAGIQQSVPVL